MTEQKRKGRLDMFDSLTDQAYPAVQSLGHSALHGPSIDQHVVFILGVGPGLGLAIAKIFAYQGYTVATASRNKQRLDKWAEELNQIIHSVRKDSSSSKESLAFSCDVLSTDSIKKVFQDIKTAWPNKCLGTAVFNASVRKRANLLELRPEQLQDSVQASIFGGFTFIQTSIEYMEKYNQGKGGNVLITGATSSTRGRKGYAAFAASKGGLRQICQSVAREFGPKHIHVAHIVVDGLIDSEEARDFFGLEKHQRFARNTVLLPEEMAKTWLFLASQTESTWTFEMDLRPAKEHF